MPKQSIRAQEQVAKTFSDDAIRSYERSKPQFIVLITAILLSNFSLALDSSLAASAYTAIASAFNKGNLSTWPVNAFLITSMTVQPLYAPISNHIGRRVPYLIASSVFLIGIVLSANAPTWSSLIAARALCGLGVGGVATMVLLTDVVGLEKRGYYQSLNYIVYGLGSAVGSGLGGVLVEHLGWSWVYKAQISVVISAFLLLYVSAPTQPRALHGFHSDRPTSFIRDFDWSGSVCLVAFLTSLFCAASLGGNIHPWTHPYIMLTGLGSATSLAFFMRVEKRAVTPILPLVVFNKFPGRNIIFTAFLFSFINYIVIYNVPAFFQTVLLQSPQYASAHLIVPSISFTLVSAMTAFLISKRKSPAMTLYISQAILILGASGLVLLTTVFPKYHVTSWIYDAMLMLPASGASMMAPSSLLTLLNLVDDEEHAVVNGGFIMARSLGVFASTTLSTITVQGSFRAALKDSDTSTQTKLEEVSKDTSLIKGLDEHTQAQAIASFQRAYVVLSLISLLAASLILLCLVNIRPGTLVDRAILEKPGSSRNTLVEEDPRYSVDASMEIGEGHCHS